MRHALRENAVRLGVGLSVAATVALWRTRFHAVATADGTWRGVQGLPSPWMLTVAAVVGLLAVLALDRTPRRVRVPLLALGLAAAPFVPVLTGRLLFLLVPQGAALYLVVCTALGVAATRVSTAPRVKPILLFAAAFAFYWQLGPHLPGPAGPQGDEPHYLVMAHSLATDGDLDVHDEYAEKAYLAFYAGELTGPHVRAQDAQGRQYSTHSPGVSAIIAPGYRLAGYRGARIVVWLLVALAAMLFHRLAREVLADEKAALAAWAVLVFSPPFALFAMRIYPEVPAALASITFLWTARRRLDWRSAAAASAAVAVLPWLHTKFTALALVGLVLTVVRPGRWILRVAVCAAFGVSLAAMLFAFSRWYGSASLAAAHGNPHLALFDVPRGLLALFFDRQYGLVPSAPVWLLASAGAVALWRKAPSDLARAALLAAPVVGIAAAFPDWTAGACPPARYLVPVVPMLALAVAAAIPSHRTAAAALGFLGIGFVALATDAPRVFHNSSDGENHLLRHVSPAFDLDTLLPYFVDPGWVAPLVALALLAAALVALRWGARAGAAAAMAYVLLAGALQGFPSLNARVATGFLLMDWDADNWTGPQGPPPLDALSMPFEFVDAPKVLTPGLSVNSNPAFTLPPGAYRLRLEMRAGGPMRAQAGLLSSGVPLESLEVSDARPSVDVPVLMPVGAVRLRLEIAVLEGRAEIAAAAIVPQHVVPASERTGLDWLKQHRLAATYRHPIGDLRVSVVEGSVPASGGFQIEGNAQLVVDGPAGSRVELWVERPESFDPRETLVWGRREIPLGQRRSVRVQLPFTEGIELGERSIASLRLRSPGAWIRIAPAP